MQELLLLMWMLQEKVMEGGQQEELGWWSSPEDVGSRSVLCWYLETGKGNILFLLLTLFLTMVILICHSDVSTKVILTSRWVFSVENSLGRNLYLAPLPWSWSDAPLECWVEVMRTLARTTRNLAEESEETPSACLDGSEEDSWWESVLSEGSLTQDLVELWTEMEMDSVQDLSSSEAWVSCVVDTCNQGAPSCAVL